MLLGLIDGLIHGYNRMLDCFYWEHLKYLFIIDNLIILVNLQGDWSSISLNSIFLRMLERNSVTDFITVFCKNAQPKQSCGPF